MKNGRPHPAAALVVSALALVAAVSGTAVAVVAAENGDKLIAKHSLSGDRLRANTVTGNQVKESTLRTPALVWHKLTLQHGWENYNGTFRPPAYAVDAQGIIHLRGAIHQTSGTNAVFARLPANLHPKADLWVVTDLIQAAPGRIDIHTTGVMDAEAAIASSDAQQFTNLDGVNWAK